MESRAGRGAAILPVAIAFLCVVSPAAAGEDCLAAAKGIGDFLLKHARRDGADMRWAQYEGPGPDAKGEERRFPVSLYSGLAGTGYFLLNLYRATKDERYLEAARGAGLHLLRTAKPLGEGAWKWEATYERRGRSVPDGGRVGLYVGNAGIGLFLMYLHDASGDARFRQGAEAAFARILGKARTDGPGLRWEHASRDIIGGEAGIGLALLEMHRLTGDAKYRDVARKAGRWLLSVANRNGSHVRWQRHDLYDASFSHGAAGIAFFLHAAQGEAVVEAARGAAEWVASAARPCGEGAVLWEYYAGTPPSGKKNWVMNSWCHGAPGTIRLFLRLHRDTGDERHLATALAGGGGIRHETRQAAGKPFYYNPTYCCGAAGCIDAFSDLYQASGEARWLKAAQVLADDVIRSFRAMEGGRVYATYDEEDQAQKENPYVATGFMHGNAGIGHALLRLALLAAGEHERLVLLPDHPFAPLARH
ncbi:MAG: lanthionine synthetase LanC family protein [Planctomycetota bacterium]|jgi:lantibiotic modifying enzyme